LCGFTVGLGQRDGNGKYAERKAGLRLPGLGQAISAAHARRGDEKHRHSRNADNTILTMRF
jgi:hypothetical protein